MNTSTMHFHNYEIQPGPLNITFGSDISYHIAPSDSYIYVVNSDMKNVIGMSDPNVMFKGPGWIS